MGCLQSRKIKKELKKQSKELEQIQLHQKVLSYQVTLLQQYRARYQPVYYEMNNKRFYDLSHFHDEIDRRFDRIEQKVVKMFHRLDLELPEELNNLSTQNSEINNALIFDLSRDREIYDPEDQNVLRIRKRMTFVKNPYFLKAQPALNQVLTTEKNQQITLKKK